MSESVKFTQEELKEIITLQESYQQKIFELGQIRLQLIDVDSQKENLLKEEQEIIKEWKGLQTSEENIINKLSTKYGDGKLDLKDGTFTPITK